jgi:hypothetical protein
VYPRGFSSIKILFDFGSILFFFFLMKNLSFVLFIYPLYFVRLMQGTIEYALFVFFVEIGIEIDTLFENLVGIGGRINISRRGGCTPLPHPGFCWDGQIGR